MNKFLAAIIMTILGAVMLGFLVNLLLAPFGKATLDKWSATGPLIALAATITITVWAPSGRAAWRRLCMLNGLASLALPLVGIVFSVLVVQHSSELGQVQMSSDAARIGAAIGAGIGGAAVSVMLGFVGFFLGMIFLAVAFALRREPR